jgi:SAM-dependent methyltransferase
MSTSLHDHHACMLCGQSRHALAHEGIRYAERSRVWRCEGCGLVALWPLPSNRDLAEYYSGDYVREYEVPPIAHRFRDDVPEARVRAARVRPLLEPATGLIEIGSGSGAFLDAVRPFVAGAAGVEPDEEGRSFIAGKLGLEAWARIEDVASSGRRFGIVTMFHVLEHVPDPVAFVRQTAALLAPEGKLVIEVPNIDDALMALYKVPSFPSFYYQKAHLHYFSPSTLAEVLRRAGFTATVDGIQRYDISNHLRWMQTGRPGGQGYFAPLSGAPVSAAYADALVKAGYADTLWAVARASSAAPSGAVIATTKRRRMKPR